MVVHTGTHFLFRQPLTAAQTAALAMVATQTAVEIYFVTHLCYDHIRIEAKIDSFGPLQKYVLSIF